LYDFVCVLLDFLKKNVVNYFFVSRAEKAGTGAKDAPASMASP